MFEFINELFQKIVDLFNTFYTTLTEFLTTIENAHTQINAIRNGNYDSSVAIALGTYRYIVGDTLYFATYAVMIFAGSLAVYLAVVKFIDLWEKRKKNNQFSGFKKIPKPPIKIP